MAKKKWIQKANASIKRRGTKGVCTGSKFGGPSCPPGSKRYALAKTFKAMARSRKHPEGGVVGDPNKNKSNVTANEIAIANTGNLPIVQDPYYYAKQLYEMSKNKDKYELSNKSFNLTPEIIAGSPELQGLNRPPKKYTTYKEKASGKEYKYPAYTYNEIQEFSVGGILSSTLAGAGSGALTGTAIPIPFLGNAAGAVIGGLVGLGKGLVSHFKERKEEKAEEAALKQQQKATSERMNLMQTTQTSFNPYTATLPFGGKVPFGANAELEKQEIMLYPNGNTAGVNGPSHSQGGVPVAAMPGTKVLSDRLKTSKGKTFAEAGKKFSEILNDPKQSTLARKTAKRSLDNLFEEQEALKAASGHVGEGLPQHGFGDIIGKVGDFIGSDKGANILSTIGELAPVAYNLFRGMGQKPEQLNAPDFYNPEAGSALSLMQNRRFNVNPTLRSNTTSYNSAIRNIQSTAGSRGELMSNSLAALQGKQMADAAAYAQKNNADLGYLGEEAQMRAQLGQQRASTDFAVADLNAKNRAAQRGFTSTAFGQLGDFAQNKLLGRNQKEADLMMGKSYSDYMNFLSGGASVRPGSFLPIPSVSGSPVDSTTLAAMKYFNS